MEELNILDLRWRDIFLDHYTFSLLICVLVVLITFIISKKFNLQTNISKRAASNEKHELKSDSTSDPLLTPTMPKSPALAAEKVIQANMTDEQRKLEFEVRQKQLAQIHELMLKQSDKFGNISLSDVEEQMKLYQ